MKRSHRIVVALVLVALAVGFVAIGLGWPAPKSPPPVVVVDAGHGGYDPGAIGVNGVEEKDITLAVAQLVRMEALNDPRVDIVLTRSTDVFVDLADRIEQANRLGAALYISLHVNAYYDGSVCGVETYVDKDEPRNGDSIQLANLLQKRLVEATAARDRGVRRASLYLSGAEMPAALVEMGFITQAQECASLRSLSTQRAIASAVYEAILAALGEDGA